MLFAGEFNVLGGFKQFFRSKVVVISGPSNEWIDILTKYQSLSLRELKYRNMNGYLRYGLYKLYNQSWHGVVVTCQSQQLSEGPHPPLFFTSCSLLQPNTIPLFTHDFKHSDHSILTGLSLMHCQVIIRRAPEKIHSGSADIGGIDKISIAI